MNYSQQLVILFPWVFFNLLLMSFINKGQKEIYFTNLHYFYMCCKLLTQWENYPHRTYSFPEFLIFLWTIAGNPGIPWCPRFAFFKKNTCSWLRKTQWVYQIGQMNGLLHLPRFLQTCSMCSRVFWLFSEICHSYSCSFYHISQKLMKCTFASR